MSTLREVRKAKGYSQYELAKITGMYQATISGIERNTIKPTKLQMALLEQILGDVGWPIDTDNSIIDVDRLMKALPVAIEKLGVKEALSMFGSAKSNAELTRAISLFTPDKSGAPLGSGLTFILSLIFLGLLYKCC